MLLLVESGAGSLQQWHVVMAMPCLQVKRSQQAILQRQRMHLPQVALFHPGSLPRLLGPPLLLLWSRPLSCSRRSLSSCRQKHPRQPQRLR